jgi:hypothetical protein
MRAKQVRGAIVVVVLLADYDSITGFSSCFPPSHTRSLPKTGACIFGITTRTAKPKEHRRALHNPQVASLSATSEIPGSALSDHLITSLDLLPLLQEVARHAGTRRGYDSILSMAKHDPARKNGILGPSNISSMSSSNNRKKKWLAESTPTSFVRTSPAAEATSRPLRKVESPPLPAIAQSVEDIHRQYQQIEEATLLLSSDRNDATQRDNNENEYNQPQLPNPPIYGVDSGPWDTGTIPHTDNDEWLYLPAGLWDAEHVIQAEQVINMLLQIKKWSHEGEIPTWVPSLAAMAGEVLDGGDKDDDRGVETAVHEVYEEIKGTVEIVRVRSAMDPMGKSSYNVRIKDSRFPVLGLLRKKEHELLKGGGKTLDKSVVEIRNEIEATTEEILSGLAQRILRVAAYIDKGLNIVAQLDVVMAKAAFGASLNGVIPLVQTEGQISVEGFVHPVLARTVKMDRVVPVDLCLSSDKGQRALVISGANGGGKTLSMKSFGLASVLTKLGLPIPVKRGAKRPRVDFFDEILVSVGDRQSVLDGESTWTSTMNKCASILNTMDSQLRERQNRRYLVLLDELGSGTDPEAGGAVAQAILEELLTKPCKIVVTTHSPRLRAMSYNNPDFNCATVLLKEDPSSLFKSPSFILEYGIIGQSHALGAASRSSPSFPPSVLTRASQLMAEAAESNGDGIREDYILALTKSMEEQLKRANDAADAAEALVDDSAKCRRAMIALADSYDQHLERLCEKLEDCFRRLKADGKSDLELVGATLSELRIVKKKIASHKTVLLERGLKVLPMSYVLIPGESVVIIAPGEWEGMSAKVVNDYGLDRTVGQNEVLVMPSNTFHAWDDLFVPNLCPMPSRPLILQRHEIAIWDYGSVDDNGSNTMESTTSIPNSKQKINSLLTALKSIWINDKEKPSKGSESKAVRKNSFQSSRQRKAAKKKQS